MNQSTKLLSASVALKKKNMTRDYLASHHELISGISIGERRAVMVTFGLYARTGVPVGVYISVNPLGREPSLGVADNFEAYYTTIRATSVTNEMGVFLMTQEIGDICFLGDGLYEANVRLFPPDERPTESNQLDSIKCFFYVLTSMGEQDATGN